MRSFLFRLLTNKQPIAYNECATGCLLARMHTRRERKDMDRKTQEQYIHGSTFLLSNRYQIIGDRKLGGEVTMKQWILLIIASKIQGEGLSINRLADFMGYSRQNATKMLLLLEKKGYVRLLPSKLDRRAKNVELTEKTYEYFRENNDIGNRLLDKTFAGITDKEVEAAFGVVSRLLENTESIMEELEHEKGNSDI